MRIGFCMLLWTTHVVDEHRALIEDIAATGYDGIEVPIFEGDARRTTSRLGAHARRDRPRAHGDHRDPVAWTRTRSPTTRRVRQAAVALPERTASTARRRSARRQIAGPVAPDARALLGQRPTDDERARARDVHREAGESRAANGVTLVLEAINRFECYFVNTMDDAQRAYLRRGRPPRRRRACTTRSTPTSRSRTRSRVDAQTATSHQPRPHLRERPRRARAAVTSPWAETFEAIKDSGYDGWLTIEAFGRALPELAAATRIWRDLAESPEAVYRGGVPLHPRRLGRRVARIPRALLATLRRS